MQRSLVFDLDGVLTHGWHYLPEKRKPWFATLQNDLGVNTQKFIKAYFGTAAEMAVLTGQRTLKQVLTSILPETGYHGDPALFINYWMKHDCNMNQPLLNAIKKVRETGAATAFVATNNGYERAEFMRDEVGLGRQFDNFFFAADLRAAKPDIAFFRACEARMTGARSLPPLFFDDNPKIVEGAKRAGWEGVVYNDIEDFLHHPAINSLLQADRKAPVRIKSHRLGL